MRNAFSVLAAALMAAAATPAAQAYTPESGTWWNPDEPGTGLQIEIQDNFIAVFGYAYDAAGNPTWVTAQGFLTGSALFESSNNPNDGSWLNTFSGGQCIGCAFPGYPDAQLGSQGRIRIVFDPDDPTRAELTWGGRTTPIQRFQFYLKRAEDGAAAPLEITKMLGEWQMVLDFTRNQTRPGYYGDVLVFDRFEFDQGQNRWFFDGCRAEFSLDGFCADDALDDHPASGFYIPSLNRHGIVVIDGFDSSANADVCVYYEARVGTNTMEGLVADIDDFSADRGGFTVYYCGEDPFDPEVFNPVRGFRTASRTFVEEGQGPSSAQDVKAASAHSAPLPLSRSERAVVRSDADRKQLDAKRALVRTLEARLGVGQSRR